jgi:hypothetical protein
VATGANPALLPALAAGQKPLEWAETHLKAQNYHMKPLKQRKFVERIEGT